MLRQSLKATEYHELQERVEDVQLLLRQLGPDAGVQSLEQRFADIYQIKDDGKYLQVVDQDGQWIYRSRRMIDAGLLPAAPGLLPPDGTLDQFHQGTRYVRVLTYPIHVNGRAYSVQTGLAVNKSMVLLSSFGGRLLLLTPAVLILAAIGGHFMSRKALAPVAAIAVDARRINDRNLDIRLPVAPTRDEISDLSETLNQMLQRVESGVRSTRDFTANAAHELRTPLALIRTEVEVALSRMRSAGEYREACENVQLESIRMTGLIDSLLMLARVDAGNEALCFEPIEANQMVRQLSEKWKTSMQLALLSFEVELAPELLFILGDANSLQRLLTILLDNAVRYTPPGGSVQLRVARQDGCAISLFAIPGLVSHPNINLESLIASTVWIEQADPLEARAWGCRWASGLQRNTAPAFRSRAQSARERLSNSLSRKLAQLRLRSPKHRSTPSAGARPTFRYANRRSLHFATLRMTILSRGSSIYRLKALAATKELSSRPERSEVEGPAVSPR